MCKPASKIKTKTKNKGCECECECITNCECCLPGFKCCKKYDKFNTWSLSVATNNLIYYPKNEDELRSLVLKSKKVRIVGTKHTTDGFIQQKSEKGITLISLAEFTPIDSWNGVLNKTDKTIKISAGNTFLDLMEIVRPQGYIMRTQTAGMFFSIGGVVMNPSVHGGTFHEDRLCSLVSSLRVMDYEGIVNTLESEQDIYEWRGSLGLLGIVLGVSLELRKEDKTLMIVIEKTSFDTDSFSDFDGSETFYNPYNGIFQTLAYNFSNGPEFDKKRLEKTEIFYNDLIERNPDLAKSGAIQDLPSSISQLLSEPINDNRIFGQLMTEVAFTAQREDWLSNYKGSRDLYYLNRGIPKFNSISAFIPLELAMEAIVIGQEFLQNIIENPNSEWYPNVGMEFRFICVTEDTLLLDHLNPGEWISLEMVNLKDIFFDSEYGPYFMELEQKWLSLGAKIHHGKGYAYDHVELKPNLMEKHFKCCFTKPIPNNLVSPFINREIIENVYSQEIITEFKKVMEKWDPQGKFAAGAALRLLSFENSSSFEPHKPKWWKRLFLFAC
jgi:hypothetical protein